MKCLFSYLLGTFVSTTALIYLYKRGVINVWFMYSIISSRDRVVTRNLWCLFNF